MKMTLVRITEQEAGKTCWMCGEPLWHEPVQHWNKAIQEYVTDPYQHAFRLKSDSGMWSRLICDTCSYTDADDLKEHFLAVADGLQAEADDFRALAEQPLIPPSDQDRQQEDQTIDAWNRG